MRIKLQSDIHDKTAIKQESLAIINKLKELQKLPANELEPELQEIKTIDFNNCYINILPTLSNHAVLEILKEKQE